MKGQIKCAVVVMVVLFPVPFLLWFCLGRTELTALCVAITLAVEAEVSKHLFLTVENDVFHLAPLFLLQIRQSLL